MDDQLTTEQITAKIAEFESALDDASIAPTGAVGQTSVTVDQEYINRLESRLDYYRRLYGARTNGGVPMPTRRGCC